MITLTFAMSVIVFALSINFRWSILTFRNLFETEAGQREKRQRKLMGI